MTSVIDRNARPRKNVRRLSAPRELTLTELGLRDTRFERSETPHQMLSEAECPRLRCATHEKTFEMDCGE